MTNETWESFWLNEGWTMMLERKIMMRLRPPPRRRRRAGWQTAASRSAGRARRESVLLLEPFLLLSEPFGPCCAQEPPGGLCSRGAAHAARRAAGVRGKAAGPSKYFDFLASSGWSDLQARARRRAARGLAAALRAKPWAPGEPLHTIP